MTGPDASIDLVTCGECASEVATGRHCTLCGARLDQPGAQRGFAASPDQSPLIPHITSTLLPQLPRADLDVFNLALGIGSGLVVMLAALGYHPVALVAGAVVVPLLLLVYLVAVDVYEDEPLRVLLLTVAWGTATGALYALVLRNLFPGTSGPFAVADTFDDVLRGIVLPAVATAVMIAGPAVLLPYRRFNDVLDGATFGALSGVSFVGAQIVVQSVDLLAAGLQPGGDVFDWVLRVIIHSVAMPLVAAGAIGGACATLWLRYRAPGHDRRALGLLGAPVVAIGLAAGLVIAANLTLLHLRDVPRLVTMVVLALVAIVWLRIVIHEGLRQEAVEAVLAEARACQNCGRLTTPGSFCRECGVSLRALPKRGAAAAPAAAPAAAAPAAAGEADPVGESARRATDPRWDQPSRLSGMRSLLLFLSGLGIAVAIVAAVAFALAPGPVEPVCDDPGAPCPASAGRSLAIAPDHADLLQQAASDPMRFGTTYRDPGLGWELDYNANAWGLSADAEPGAVWLSSVFSGLQVDVAVRIEVVPAAERTRAQMIERLQGLAGGFLESLAEQPEHGRAALAPHLGYAPADARYLEGDAGEAGSITRWGVYVMTASNGLHTAGVSVYLTRPDAVHEHFAGTARTVRKIGDHFDALLERFVWPDPAAIPGSQAATRTDNSPLLPDAFRRAYGIDRLHEMGLRGQGQTVAIISFGTYLDSDMVAWDARTGSTGPAVQRVQVGEAATLNDSTVEVLLDLQTVRAIAPEATIINVEGTWGDGGYVPFLQAIEADAIADVVSISYGACERLDEMFPDQDYSGWAGYLQGVEGAFREAADADITVFASSGDEGVYGCVRSAPKEEYAGLVSAIYPSSFPSVVSVGGTLMWRQSDGGHLRETAWNGPLSGEGTGGGASRIFPMPEWQQSLGLPGSMRITPDVSGPADPESGLLFMYTTPCVPTTTDAGRCDAPCELAPCEYAGGGTSQAAPFWAGVSALIRQAAEQEGLLDPDGDGTSRLPWLLPMLYEIHAERPDAFRDVVAGSNFVDQAVPGWDAATGLGSPEVPVLLEAMLEHLRSGGG